LFQLVTSKGTKIFACKKIRQGAITLRDIALAGFVSERGERDVSSIKDPPGFDLAGHEA
jgi:hypothetical protein